MKNNEGKITESSKDIPKTQWTIDYKKCTVCGECIYACKLRLLDIKDKRIIIIDQFSCDWCGDCSSACAYEAIVLT